MTYFHQGVQAYLGGICPSLARELAGRIADPSRRAAYLAGYETERARSGDLAASSFASWHARSAEGRN